MGNTYFDRFCEIIDDYTILKTSTAIGVQVDLKDCIKKIKSEVLLELQSKSDNRNDYLDFLINEIERRDYINDADIKYVQKWLDEYQISIEDIFNMNFGKNDIERVIDSHYNDMDKFSKEKDKAYLLQLDFYNYFCKYYADILINILKSYKKVEIKSNHVSEKEKESKMYKDAYLNDLLKYFSTTEYIYETCFLSSYSMHLQPTIEKVIIEIEENLLAIPENKIDNYINLVIKKIEYCDVVLKGENVIDKWIKKYNLEGTEFPFTNVPEIKRLIITHPYNINLDGNELFEVEDIQIDFYIHACIQGANQIIDFLQSKKSTANEDYLTTSFMNNIEKLKWIGKPSQLGLIIGKLAELGYIEAPIKPNGDTNYNQFARLVNNTFEVATTEGTLSKYLNHDSEKGQETVRKFNDNGFNIPHIKEVS
jgi:hypothetical protein